MEVSARRAAANWRLLAACRGMDVELFYSLEEEDCHRALAVCARCPVRAECCAAAMTDREAYGVWGGTLETQRRRVFRREQRQRQRERRREAADADAA